MSELRKISQWMFVDDDLAPMFAEQRSPEWARAVGRPSQVALEDALDLYDAEAGILT